MPPKSLDPWLADFLSEELTAVIAWKHSINNDNNSNNNTSNFDLSSAMHHIPLIKPDPDAPLCFTDDGSNFRSHVDSPPLPNTVQLIQVLAAVDEGASVVLSDGHIKVRAQLSAHVVASFEEETDSRLTPQVAGDVFQLNRFTVVSTPFGPADAFIQLSVDDIDYHYALRKTYGNPTYAHEDAKIRPCVDEIKELRRLPAVSDDEEDTDEEEVDVDEEEEDVDEKEEEERQDVDLVEIDEQVVDVVEIDEQDVDAAEEEEAEEAEEASVEELGGEEKGKGKKAASDLGASLAFTSQYLIPRRTPRPTLADDGFQMEDGVNLDRPSAASTSNFTQRPLSPPVPDATRRMLALFKNTGNANEAATAQVAVQDVPTSSTTIPSQPPVVETPVIQRALPPITSSATQLHLPVAETPVEHSAPPSFQLPPPSNATSTQPSTASSRDLGRRKIPDNQRKILDHHASWVNPLPGNPFLHPNVPIEILARWNADADAAVKNPDTTEQGSQASQQQKARSETSEESDEPVSQSEWPPSQASSTPRRRKLPPPSSMVSDAPVSSWPASPSPQRPRQPSMPPPSSFSSVIHGTPDDLEVAAPKPLGGQNIPKRPVHPHPSNAPTTATAMKIPTGPRTLLRQQPPLTPPRQQPSSISPRYHFSPSLSRHPLPSKPFVHTLPPKPPSQHFPPSPLGQQTQPIPRAQQQTRPSPQAHQRSPARSQTKLPSTEPFVAQKQQCARDEPPVPESALPSSSAAPLNMPRSQADSIRDTAQAIAEERDRFMVEQRRKAQ